MPFRIIIDGYNFIRQSSKLRSYESLELAKGRDKLIEMLVRYRTFKQHPIVVVFDGWQEGSLIGKRTIEKGIEIIYSKRGEKADEVIKRLVSKSRDDNRR